MKKYLLLIPTLVLLGAGCSGTTAVDLKTTDRAETTRETDQADTSATLDSKTDTTTTSEAGTKTDASVTIKAVDIEGTNPAATAEATATITTDSESTAKTSVEIKTDEVPVTDVVLGGETKLVDMEAGNFFFKPDVINASVGEKIKINFTKNAGFHTFVIKETGQSFAIKQGESVSFNAPDKAGTYTFYCDVGSHQAMGMEGTLIVK